MGGSRFEPRTSKSSQTNGLPNWMLFTRSLEKRFHNMLNWKQKLMFYFKSKKAIYLFIFYCNILGAFATICWLLVRYDSRFTCISHQKREFKNRKGGSGGVQMKKVTKKLVQIKNKFAYLNGERLVHNWYVHNREFVM